MRPILLAALAALLLAACQTPRGTAQPAAVAGGAAATAAQGEVDQALDAVLRLREEGATDPEPLASAMERYRSAATRCLATAGCDAARIAEGALELVGPGGGLQAVGEDLPAVADEGGSSPVTTHLPEASRSVNLLNGRDLRDVIALNGPVKAALTEWLTWMRPQLVDAWEHYQDMRHLMWPEYRSAGLPEALLFGILAKESGGKVHAVSRAGASGPLQFMPATGLRYGLGQVDGFDTRFDPQRATRANVAYLNDRFAEFNHNLELALAAYNGGEGRVGRLYARAPNKSFWDASVYWSLPPETRDYVPMVLAAAWLFLHPEEHGLEFPGIETAPGTVTLERDTTLNALAICLGNAGRRDGWFRALRNLNPRYMPDSSLPAGTQIALPEPAIGAYRANCLDAPLAQLAMELTSARGPAQPKARTYVVRPGDSLHAIARRHNCTVSALAGSNQVRAPKYLIRPGQTLSLAACG